MNTPLTEEEEWDNNIITGKVYELIFRGTQDIGKFTSSTTSGDGSCAAGKYQTQSTQASDFPFLQAQHQGPLLQVQEGVCLQSAEDRREAAEVDGARVRGAGRKEGSYKG